MNSPLLSGPVRAGRTACLVAGVLGAACLPTCVLASAGLSTFPALQLKPATHMYVNVGLTHVRPRDRSSQFADASGPVVRQGDEFTPGLLNGTAAGVNAASTLQFLSANMRADRPQDLAAIGLGTPLGATVDAGNATSPTVSVGVYLDEEQTWAVEAYVAGLPFEVKVQGQGRIGSTEPGGVDLGEVMSIKQLGPIVFAKHVFGRKGDRFRASLGLGGAYIVFFDGKVSSSASQYVGGKSTVSLKNAWGPGVFMGGEYRLDERWSLVATLGHLWLKTEGTLVTQTDPAVLGRSRVVEQAAADVGKLTQTAVQFTNGTLTGGSGALNGPSNQLPTVLRELARARTGDPNNLGTYVRKIHTTLNPWLFTVGVGYAF